MAAEIYRSVRLADCEQRAFLLYAVGIPSEIVVHGHEFALVVAEESRNLALNELLRHEAEARAIAAKPTPLRLHAHAWIGSLAYALIMIVAAYCAGENLFGADWRAAGALHGALASSGEWFRLVTALTLHGDVAHLIANLAFGVFFGYFAGQMLGPGVAWLSILIAAVAGNLLDSLLMSTTSASIGASTAVFATLGLVAAHSWRAAAGGAGPGNRENVTASVRSGQPQEFSRFPGPAPGGWARRWAPLIAAVALLAFTGAGGENTDVIAHITGFLSGAAVGALHALRSSRRWFEGAMLQSAAGLLAVSVIAGAWVVALT